MVGEFGSRWWPIIVELVGGGCRRLGCCDDGEVDGEDGCGGGMSS